MNSCLSQWAMVSINNSTFHMHVFAHDFFVSSKVATSIGCDRVSLDQNFTKCFSNGPDPAVLASYIR